MAYGFCEGGAGDLSFLEREPKRAERLPSSSPSFLPLNKPIVVDEILDLVQVECKKMWGQLSVEERTRKLPEVNGGVCPKFGSRWRAESLNAGAWSFNAKLPRFSLLLVGSVLPS